MTKIILFIKTIQFVFPKFQISKFLITRPDFQFGVPKKHKVATKLISYKIYREILFHKVASGYLLHFVQDGIGLGGDPVTNL